MDLLRPIRTRGWVVVVLIVVAVGVSLGLSLSEPKRYSAVATFTLRDESHDLSLVGLPVAPALTPAQLSSQAAQTISSLDVLRRVKRSLNSPLSTARLGSSVSASVDPNANDVHVQATAATPHGAAALANATAAAAVDVSNRVQRATYAAAAREFAKENPVKGGSVSAALQREQLDRLRELAAIATPAQMTTSATPPGGPSSPKPLRNAGIAGFLGLLMGLFVVYVWDSLDRRITTAADIERQLGFPLVGQVRDDALGSSLTPGNGNRSVDPIDWEQFRILRRNVEMIASGRPTRAICVTSAVAEEGKSTVALFMAFAAAAAGKRVLLMECDLRRPVLADRLGIKAAPGITDFATGAAQPEDIVQVVPFIDPLRRNGTRSQEFPDAPPKPTSHGEVTCITAGSHTEYPTEILESRLFAEMFEHVHGAYDVVILDTPPLLPVVDAFEVIKDADVIVFCARTQKLTRDQARVGRQALQRLPERPVGLVVTGVGRGEEYYSSGDYYGSRR